MDSPRRKGSRPAEPIPKHVLDDVEANVKWSNSDSNSESYRSMKCIIVLALLLITASAPAAESVRPNVIVIYTDDQGCGDASCLNPDSKFKTPNLDRFRGQGKAGAYGEFMIETDWHVGRILEFLDNEGLTENTLIVFTSDNGAAGTVAYPYRRQRPEHAR